MSMLVVSDGDSAVARSAASGLPRYRQIANALRDRIHRREWTTTQRLPGEEQLAVQFGVSKLTMRQALGVLLAESLIRRVHGKGTYVTDMWQPTTRLTYSRPIDEVLREPPSASVRVLDAGLVGGPRAEFEDLAIGEDGSAFRLRRVHLLEGKPRVYVVSYLRSELSSLLEASDLEEVPFIVALERRIGLQFREARMRIASALADDEMAAQLRVPVGSAVLLVHRTYYSADGQPEYVAQFHYAGGAFQYEVRLRRDEAQTEYHVWAVPDNGRDREQL